MNFRHHLIWLPIAAAVCSTSWAQDPPGPAPDNVLTSSFEGAGQSRSFTETVDMVVPADGLPMILHEDFNTFYLAKCQRLDCATGVVERSIGATANLSDVAALGVGSDGLPIILFMDTFLGAGRFEKCNDQQCEDREKNTIFVGRMSGPGIGIGPDGFPVITYWDRNTTQLWFEKCQDLACDQRAPARMLDTSQGDVSSTEIIIASDGSPMIAYVGLERIGGTNTYTLRTAHCDASDCGGDVTVTAFDTGALLGVNGSTTKTVQLLLPDDGFPVLGFLSLSAGGSGQRYAAIKCSDFGCTDYDEPVIVGAGTSYFSEAGATLSADSLPIFVADSFGAVGQLNLMICQTQDCANGVTNIGWPEDNVSGGQLPAVGSGVDGNPIVVFRRSDRVGVLHCRDPECQDWRTY